MSDEIKIVLTCRACNHQAFLTGTELIAKVGRSIPLARPLSRQALSSILKRFRCSKCNHKNLTVTSQRGRRSSGQPDLAETPVPAKESKGLEPRSFASFTLPVQGRIVRDIGKRAKHPDRAKRPPDRTRGASTRFCSVCSEPISPARLEAIPDATSCVRCKEERDNQSPESEELTRCKRCGAEMVWRKTTVSPTKYFQGCSRFPKCRYVIGIAR